MKKKKNTPDAILGRAEKLFKKGNYSLAKSEFQKVSGDLQHEHIREKIKICSEKIAEQKARDLIKKGRKSLKKNNLREALRCFGEAYELSEEEWLLERIGELKAELAEIESFGAAKEAENLGDYEKAADLYGEALGVAQKQELFAKKVSLFVKAEKYEEAVSAFREIELPDDAAKYDCGFALAKTGKYYDCLKIWDTAEFGKQSFSDQKAFVQSLLAADLLRSFEDTENSERVCRQGTYLIENSEPEKSSADLRHIVEYARYVRLGQLWYEEQYEAMRELLLPYPPEMNSDLLEIYAKLFFKLAEISQAYFSDFVMFWLTALCNPEICRKLSADEKERDAARQTLLERAEKQIETYGDQEKLLRIWNIEKEMVEDLRTIAENQKHGSPLICTSGFARKFGGSRYVIALIRKNRDFFSDTDHYLSTGAFYSPAGKSLSHIWYEEYEEAIAALPEQESKNDEFSEYGIQRVYFAYGLHCLKKGDTPYGKYFENVALLFEKSPGYEKEFTDRAIDANGSELQGYENALTEIYSIRPSDTVREALSLVMVRYALNMFKKRKFTLKSTEARIKKAMKLNPKNEFGLAALDEMQLNLEMERFANAIDRHKINKACQIATKSEYTEVRESFFDFIRYNLGHMDKADMSERKQLLLLNDFSKWCARVDESHPIVRELDKRLARLGEDN